MPDYLVVDTETTGMDPKRDRLVEVAGVWRGAGGELVAHHSLCDPGVDIPPEAQAIHHIGNEDVWDAAPPDLAVSRLLRLAGPVAFLAAHNAPFDRGFLAEVAPEVSDLEWVCTWRCSMHLWPEAAGHGNQVLRYWLRLTPELPPGLHPHRALYDALVTQALLEKMLEIKTLGELARLSNQPVVLTTVRFGKHKGQAWEAVPRDYLHWVMRQNDMDEDVRHTARVLLGGGAGP